MEVIILKTAQSNFDNFKKVFEQDVKKARIFSLNREIKVHETVFFDKGIDNFQIIEQTIKYGVSVTLKRYSRKTINRKLSVNKNKFYTTVGRKTIPAKLTNLNSDEKKIFLKRFPWAQFIIDFKINLPLNTIYKHKLFNVKKAISYIYKCQYTEKLKNLHMGGYFNFYTEDDQSSRKMTKYMFIKKKIVDRFINLHLVNTELFADFEYLMDCSKMAESLDRKLDASWSNKRLTQEHDEMSNIITNVLFEMNNEPLNIRQVYIDFNEFIGGGILKDTKSMSVEGIKQRHCVATYVNDVNSGMCAIFHIEGFTLEVKQPAWMSKIDLRLSQFLGYLNKPAPQELKDKVNNLINNFNKQQNEKIEQELANTY